MNIKPAVLFFSLLSLGLAGSARALTRNTYLGAEEYDTVYGMTEALDHTVYVTGITASTDFPDTQSGAQPVYGGGNSDIFVAHLSADLGTLLGSTYVGGSGDDTGYDITYDSYNNLLYVVGSTTSTDFPATVGMAQPSYAGDGDTVVIELTPDLRHMKATYLGGSGDDTPDKEKRGTGRRISIAVSLVNGLYVTGPTTSTDFPHTAGGVRPAYNGGKDDSYVALLAPNLKRLVQATYLGGSGGDETYGMAANDRQGILVVGETGSADFPTTPGAARTRMDGPTDAFVTMLSPSLHRITLSTYFGGSLTDRADAIYTDLDNRTIYIAGTTSSHDLPAVSSGAQAVYGGGNTDAFVAVFNASLSRVLISSYLGGSGRDLRPVLTASPVNGALYVAGTTASTDFPDTSGGTQPAYPGGSSDSYLTEFTSDLTQIVQSTYLGGSSDHTGIHAIFVNSAGVYTAGATGASDIPNTEGAYQTTCGGGRDALISLFNPTLTNP